jgi:lipid-binding SYLF domain-containing protein
MVPLIRLKARWLFVPLAFFLTLGVLPRQAMAKDPTEADARQVIAQYKQTDPGLAHLFETSAGYAVFPEVAKGGFVIGGAGGKGFLFVNHKAVGKVELTQVTAGAVIGGQSYSEIVFLEDQNALNRFKASDLNLAAQVSAVGLKSGASANAKYTDGVAVITATKGGLMLEAAVGGQKFKFTPFSSTPAG